jgi:uncharacterized protein (DUF362 family)/NAD-dependent dihydropyrimidine dehydrogenase PreA subunit
LDASPLQNQAAGGEALSRVAIVHCADYEQSRVDDAVARALELLGGAGNFFHAGQKVLLKPNLLSARTPEQGVTTRIEVIRGLISAIKPLSAHIALGDSPAGQVQGIERVWQRTGMAELCATEDIEPLSFEKAGARKVPLDLPPISEVPIATPVLDSDLLVNLPKLKTHSGYLFTGAIKNCYGCIPGLAKANLHRTFPGMESFSRLIAHVYGIAKPGLNIADGVIAMHGNGPATGPLFNLGMIMASDDGVALDAVAASVFGFKPGQVPHIRIAGELGMGETDLGRIELLGDPLPQVDGLVQPTAFLQSIVPEFLLRLGSGLLTLRPKISPKICTLCRKCVVACPMGAINDCNGKLIIDRKVCINCLCCHELCEHGAVEFTGSLPVRIYLGMYKRRHRKKRAAKN